MTDNLTTLKRLLGIEDNKQDDLLSFLLADTENMVKGYCRIETVPAKLESLIPVIAADMYRTKGYGREQAPLIITAETEGSRSRSYARTADNSSDALMGYADRLAPFKSRKGRLPSELL